MVDKNCLLKGGRILDKDYLFFSALQPMFTEYKECQQHTSLVTILSGIVQAVTLRCPTALIWSITRTNIGNDPTKSQVLGSPLDRLPCAPSELVIGTGEDENDRKELEEVCFLFYEFISLYLGL